MLNFETMGDSQNPTFLIAHGLFGSGRNWRMISRGLSKEFHVVAVDMRNHGDSFWSDEMTYEAMASDLADVIGNFGTSAIVLGHSMGGKAAMVLALTRPELVNRLIVGDIAPVEYSHGYTDFIEAMQAVDLSQAKTRGDVGRALEPAIEDAAQRAFFLQSLLFDESGARWLFNLAAIKSALPTIVGWSDTDSHYEGPTLVVSGATSNYISNEGRNKIKNLFPAAKFMGLKGAGHWLHADQPQIFTEVVKSFARR